MHSSDPIYESQPFTDNKFAHRDSKNCSCFNCYNINQYPKYNECEDAFYEYQEKREQDSLKSLITHIQNQKEPPCTKFKCPNIEKCKREKIECKSFRFYVNNNDYSKKREKDIMISLREIV